MFVEQEFRIVSNLMKLFKKEELTIALDSLLNFIGYTIKLDVLIINICLQTHYIRHYGRSFFNICVESALSLQIT